MMSDFHEKVEDQADVRFLRRQIADVRKASVALQQMVDALASLPALEHFVPTALRIIARAFETSDCAYYEHQDDDLIRLRYWFLDGDVFGPEDIQAFDDGHVYAKIRPLEAGFHVPDSYLGLPFRKRTKSLVLNHGWDDFEDNWEGLRKQFGWYTVLNVPLIVDGDAVGGLVMNRGRGCVYTAPEIDLAERLGQQLALAIQVDRLAAHARSAAGAQAGELAAQMQIEEMSKTDLALRQTTDAVSAMPDLDHFIPAALQIIANSFNAKDCSYYEHRQGDPIRLQYWFFNGKVLGPTDIAELGDEHAFMRQLAVEGFTVPDSYIGVPFRKRSKASVVDHSLGDPPSVFDIECRSRGWELELNIPLVVAGEADAALLIYRGLAAPFNEREITLAERLAQQLALAMEASRLSAIAKQAAVSKERERAARERASELSRYHAVLKRTIDSLVVEQDFFGFIGRILTIVSDELKFPVAEYWLDDRHQQTRLMLTYRDGTVHLGSDDPQDVRTGGIPVSPALANLSRYGQNKTHQVIDLLDDVGFRDYVDGLGVPIVEWAAKRGVRTMFIIPLVHGEVHQGSLCLYLPEGRTLDQSQIDLAFSLGQQVSLAARMTDLAEESKQSALSREREAAANDRADELMKANALLRSTLEQLSDERDLANFPRSILRMAMDQVGARDAVIFVLDSAAKTVRAVDVLESAASTPAWAEDFARAVPLDSAPSWANAMEARAPVVYDLATEAHMLSTDAAGWHRDRGNRSVVIVPMFINTAPYGYFGMGLSQPAEAISKIDLGLIQALTQQASLAIQLTRLADESKHAALAQEREHAAEERAAEFANANEVLRSTLDQLSKERDLHSFPKTILKQAMQQTNARDGLILIYDRHADALRRSDYINALGVPESTAFAHPFSASGTPAWAVLVDKRCPLVLDVEDDAAMLLPGLAEWHRRRGNGSIIATAMFIDGQPYGYFGITLAERAADVSRVKTGLIQALAQQATLAIQLTRLAQASQQGAIMVERQQVVVQERANMAREIHDRLAQGYAAILIQQHTMRRLLLRDNDVVKTPAPLLEQLDIIECLSRENLAEARRTMDELRIDPFGPGDLASSLERCIDRLAREYDFAVFLDLEEDLPPMRRYVETELCRIVSEAVTNARRHARTDAVRVSAKKTKEGLRIAIEDDGVGFDIRAIGPSFGISSMQERAARAGARMDIRSRPGCGTEVWIVLTP